MRSLIRLVHPIQGLEKYPFFLLLLLLFALLGVETRLELAK